MWQRCESPDRLWRKVPEPVDRGRPPRPLKVACPQESWRTQTRYAREAVPLDENQSNQQKWAAGNRDEIPDWFEQGSPVILDARPVRPGRKGHPLHLYAEVAKEYVALMHDGERHPTTTLARRRHIAARAPPASRLIRRARDKGFLPPEPPGPGVPGGELTPEVRRSSDGYERSPRWPTYRSGPTAAAGDSERQLRPHTQWIARYRDRADVNDHGRSLARPMPPHSSRR